MSRLYPYAGLVLALVFAAGCGSCRGCNKNSDDAGLATRTFKFTYATTIPAPAAGTEVLDVWVPLPQNDPGVQEVADLEVKASGPHQITTEPGFGNHMVHLRVKQPSGETKVSWSALITRHLDDGQGGLPNDPRYLESTTLVPIDGEARAIAEKVGATDNSKSLEVRARAIYDDVLDGMAYDKTGEGWGRGDFDHAVTVCKGNCSDFHARFIGIGRAAGIPVRFTMGVPLKSGKTSYNSYHCWAHWYDGRHWRPVDISEADKVVTSDPAKAAWFFGHLDQNRISLTFGRDITLEPAQQGGKLNYFVFPYAEADGNKMKLNKSMWLFSWEDR